MDALLVSVWVFLGAYVLNVLYVTVFYHRGLAHEAVILSPRMRRFVAKTGIWITGIDAKAWVCMHRLHHRYSDTAKDPHSPMYGGVFGLFRRQLFSYQKVLVGLIRRHENYETVVTDLNIEVSAVNARQLWYLPYLMHLLVGIGIAALAESLLIGSAFVLGISSHPVEGWAVNALAHTFGYRNYATADNSRNNTLVAWLVAGEGYQNNHHRQPDSAKFSHRWFEWDWGYQLCLLLSMCRVLRIARADPKDAKPIFCDRAAE